MAKGRISEKFDDLSNHIASKFDERWHPDSRNAVKELNRSASGILNTRRESFSYRMMRAIVLAPVQFPFKLGSFLGTPKGIGAMALLGIGFGVKQMLPASLEESVPQSISDVNGSLETSADRVSEFVRIRSNLDVFFEDALFGETNYSKEHEVGKFLSQLEFVESLPQAEPLYDLLQQIKNEGITWQDDFRQGITGPFNSLYSVLRDNPDLIEALFQYMDERLQFKLNKMEDQPLSLADVKYVLTMVDFYHVRAQEFEQKTVDLQRVQLINLALSKIVFENEAQVALIGDAIQHVELEGDEDAYVRILGGQLPYTPIEVNWIHGRLSAGVGGKSFPRVFQEIAFDLGSYRALIEKELAPYAEIGLSTGEVRVVLGDGDEPSSFQVPILLDVNDEDPIELGYAKFGSTSSDDFPFDLCYGDDEECRKKRVDGFNSKTKENIRVDDVGLHHLGPKMIEYMLFFSMMRDQSWDVLKTKENVYFIVSGRYALFTKREYAQYRVFGISPLLENGSFDQDSFIGGVRVEFVPGGSVKADGHWLTLQGVCMEKDHRGRVTRQRDSQGKPLPASVLGRYNSMDEVLKALPMAQFPEVVEVN